MNWRTRIWLLAMVVTLVGCAPAGEPPTRGEISLQFEQMSEEGLTLTLANGLDRTVYILGDRTFLRAIRVWPPDAEVSCQGSASSALTTEFLILSRSGSKFVAIAPDKRVKIFIPTTLPQQSKGGFCWVYLVLQDDTRVGPLEFRPDAVESEPRQKAGPGETVQLGHPVIRALVLPVQEGTIVEPVSGAVYITRHGREAIDLKTKETLQHDDLLQLQGDSSARVRSPSGTELVLTQQHGEWFRFVIDDK